MIKREMRCIRVLPDEWAEWNEAADFLDVKTSEFMRQAVNRAAKRALRQKRAT